MSKFPKGTLEIVPEFQSLFISSGVLAQEYSSCAIPNYRVIFPPVPDFLEVTSNYTGTYYTGFIVDLLYAMGVAGRFTYTLKVAKNTQFGKRLEDGCFNGAAGAVASNNADITFVADVTNYVDILDFTAPILKADVQIVYNTRTGLNGAYYAVPANTATRDYIERSRNPELQAIWANILAYAPKSLPNTYAEGLALVKSGGWALIARAVVIDNDVYRSYGLLAKDPKIIRRTYDCFAVQKGSNLLQKLNRIILQLQEDGTIPALLAKWFPYSITS
jgi:ABC-type amino acid transport substrate-binding protein